MAINIISKLLIFSIVLTLREQITLGQKWPLGSKRSNKLNECQRCKVLTDSFKTWIDKTSRGKHEGGDAAWEEAKLKSYARSEMRLVEIQEGLCSELKTHKDHCYALAEEVEVVLEKWWINENYDESDLYSWLCIENLQYCCPPYHFGEACNPCPLDSNNEICGGMGNCDGDGTRKGSGKCICKKGYAGDHCDVCAKNFYSSMNICKPCNEACNGCHSDGPDACDECATGWSKEFGVCVDINECSEPYVCKSSDFCINRKGSYDCKSCDKTCSTCVGPGPKNCTSCKPNDVLWSEQCINNNKLKELYRNAFIKTTFYVICLCILLMSTFRISLASLLALAISLGIYFIESSSDFNLFFVYKQYYNNISYF
ncbi:cysteine-rich with EGF-like domain protein 2 [Bicyclus anynana]|uniref:Cysteine-rich with EGF-like domain protein 2 n=1 Tax=Bicyclus anynana TaxID=110368 RepID=A0A6J1N019_BICAN|nr:cysteine-rich with EGF-like domain protein 2 [Bicyclus anynana]